MAGASALARRAFADLRTRTVSFALLFLLIGYAQATAYRGGYPTRADRVELARSFGANNAVRLLYGQPRDLLSVGGYLSWRVGGSLVLFAAIWGYLGAVRATRAEEDAGRAELVHAGTMSRVVVFAANMVGIALGATALWLALFVGFVAGELPAGGSAYLALEIVSVVPVFVGVGTLASQVAPSRRLATGLSTGVLVVAFVLRAVGDTTSGLGWLRWASPLGWAEELRAFTGSQPAVLVLPALLSVALLVTAVSLLVRRDIGRGLLQAHDRAKPRLGLLGSPTEQALRSERGSLVAWVLGFGAVAFITGVISDAVQSGISNDLQRQLEKFGSEQVTTPAGFLGFTFGFFVLAVSIFCCTQIGAIRGEEADERLETLLALPVRRRGWLAGRLGLAAAGAALVALAAGILAWVGALTQGGGVALPDMIGAGANMLPVALFFLALGSVAFALLPRASTAIIYALVGVAFAWWTFGALLDVPVWLLALSPFHDIGLVPGEPFKAGAAVIMLAASAAAAVVAIALFERRDITAT